MPKRIVLSFLIIVLQALVRPTVAAEPTTLPATWAWQPVARPTLPQVRDQAWGNQPIDQLVLARLEVAGLRPGPSADRRALVRRAYFDLIGLPPPAEVVESFVKDTAADAYEKLMDGLLASPHFGERWARHWMDLVRYAEGFGHEFDFPIAHAYEYRDYLIRAFNADVPYNQFVTEHIAGDLLPNPRLNPQSQFNESIIGTGFWWFGEQIHAPVDVRQNQADRIDNQIDVMAKTFLGLTVACSRCHDHKFDPIKQKDYYGLFGIVESSRRQEAMLDPHGTITRIASEIQSLRAQGDEVLRRAVSAPTNLVEAIKADSELGSAAKPSHPLFALATCPKDDKDFDQWRRDTLVKLTKAEHRSTESRTHSAVFKSFAQTGYKDWVRTGWAFAGEPTRPGNWDCSAADPDIVTTPSAHSGVLSNRLKGVLSSPSFIISKPALLYHVAGQGGRVRLVIDGYRMDQFSGLLFAGAIFEVKTAGEFVWRRQAQDVSRYVGQRAHIEIIDEGDEWVAVDEIRFADADAPLPQDPPSALCAAILNDPQVVSIDALSRAYASIIALALEDFANGKTDADQAQIISWLIRHHIVDIRSEKLADLTAIKAHIANLSNQVPEPMRAVAMLDADGFDERVFVRGNHGSLGEKTPRAFLSSLAGTDQPSIESGSGRMELARRMTDPSDPLLSRVMVNRLWHHLLGRGIVASVDDFGKMGERPSNPQLLDYLADDFRTHGWSIKRMIRQIMLSRTYQMSSRAADADAERQDPNNILLHRANLRRLEAEEIRDSMLAASGRLDLTMFGPSVDVHLTEFMEGRGKPKSGPLDGAGRRSIYLAVRRNFLSPMMLAFDAPAPFNTMGRRSVSNVPAQALMLMNDPFVLQQAKKWAGHIASQNELSARQRIAAMYETAFSRPATDREIDRAVQFMESQSKEMGIASVPSDLNPAAWTDLAHGLMNAKEFIFLN